MQLAAAGDADFGFGVREPREGQNLEAAAGVEAGVAGERRAIDWVQEVDGDRLDGERTQLEEHVDDVAVDFAHADDAAGAELHAGVADGAEGAEAVVVGVGGANLAVMFAARVEVVVDLVDAAGFEAHRLLGREEAEAGADVEAIFLLDLGDDSLDGLDFTLARAAGGDHDAVGFRLPLCRHAGAVEEFVAAEEVVLGNLGVGDFRLRAVMAILGAEAAFGVHQEVKLNGVAEGRPAKSISGRQEAGDFGVAGCEDREALVYGQFEALADSLGQRHPVASKFALLRLVQRFFVDNHGSPLLFAKLQLRKESILGGVNDLRGVRIVMADARC